MRRTELKRKTPLVAKAPIKPGTKKMNAVSRTKRRRVEQRKGPSMADLRPLLWKRCGGRCEHCGCALNFGTFEAHHRKFRSRGGKDVIENLAALCGTHHRWAHGAALESVPMGYSVLSSEDPAQIPIKSRGKTLFLQPDGTYWAAAPAWIEE